MAPLQRREAPPDLGRGDSSIAGRVETEGVADVGARFIAPSAWVPGFPNHAWPQDSAGPGLFLQLPPSR